MRYYVDVMGCEVSRKKEQAAARTAPPKFFPWEQEQPLERQLDLDSNISFNTIGDALLETLC